MNARCAVRVILAGVSMSVTPTPAPAVPLATDGRAQAVVVVAPDASPSVLQAAHELSTFLGRVTGGTFDIVHEPPAEGPRLLVGPGAARWADPTFSVAGLGPEGIVTRTVNEDLILAGGAPRGTLYAVYTFLEDHVGCHWWTPDAATIPSTPTLVVGDLDMTYVPRLAFRATNAFGAQDGDWAARNKYNGGGHRLEARHGGGIVEIPDGGHTFFTLIPPARYFAERPAWFSLIDGERAHGAPHYPRTSLCLSNQDMRRELVANLRGYLRNGPVACDSAGLSEVRFGLADGRRFVGDGGAASRWDTRSSVTVTASSEHPRRKAFRAIDGSGLDTSGLLHGTDPNASMFMTGTRSRSAAAPRHPGAVTGEHWIAFAFDRARALGEMRIWNQNEVHNHFQGVRDVTIRCSVSGGADPSEWVTVFEGEVPEAAGLPDRPHQLAVDFGGRPARHVVITIHRNWYSWHPTDPRVIAEVSQPDDAGPPNRCECDACRAVEGEDGASGLLIRFVNAVAADIHGDFPDALVGTLAYHYTQPPPRRTRARDDVMVRLCGIKCSFSRPITHERNTRFREDLLGWSNVCRNLYIWDYVANFSYGLNPHPNLRVLGPNIRYYAAHGVRGVFAEALTYSPGLEMAELRSWMLARLMWDPRHDGWSLVSQFTRGYYGRRAGEHVLAWLALLHDAAEATDDWMGLSSPPDAGFLSFDTLCRGWRCLEAAERAAADDPALKRRVQVARLPLMYVFLIRWDELRREAAAANATWPMPSSASDLHGLMVQIAAERDMNLKHVPSPIAF